ncbi:hypothetical protein [Absidia glauca]|uniref:Uncharacterized protein n=1 Tax=Absidia glauca TaxID=4829 RepID=A0A168NZS8_ABSGL|nr:hypothetical protein [Absidia glauca]
MEYHEVQRLITHYKSRWNSTINATKSVISTGLHDVSDHSSVDYSSDESSSLDSHHSFFLQNIIPSAAATTSMRRYYPLPSASPLPQKKQPSQIISKPVMSKRGSSTSLSMKFVHGVHLLKHKVVSLSSSSGYSFASNESMYSSYDDSYSMTHPPSSSSSGDPPRNKIAPSEIYNHHMTKQQEPREQIPTVHRLAPPQSSPIPKATKKHRKPGRRSSPPQIINNRWNAYQPRSHFYPLITRSRSTSAAIYGFFSNNNGNKRTLSPLAGNRRSMVRKRFDSIWKRRLFKSVATPRPSRKLIIQSPDTPTLKTTTVLLSQNMADSNLHYDGLETPRSILPIHHCTSRPASTLFMHLSESIQRLQCLVDIEVQSVEDHQRDIGFFTAQLDQLNHDVQYMNKKVAGLSTNIETDLDPIEEEIQHTIPLLNQLLIKHHHIVSRFTQEVLKDTAKKTFIKLQSEIKSAECHIQRWDLITHWAFVVSMILLVCILALFLMQSIGPNLALIFFFVLAPVLYGTS